MLRPTLYVLALVAGLAFAAFASGCSTSTCPELAVYRDGMHALDETLYAEHETLLADAVKSGLRSSVEQQIVAAQIARAESHYQNSVNAGKAKPATQP